MSKPRILTRHKDGKTFNAIVSDQFDPLFCFDSLLDAGMVRVTECGEENVYFEWKADEGTFHQGYCKCL